jgi:hypothetical protein
MILASTWNDGIPINYLPTTVNMELEEYEHQMIARLVSRYPKRLSMGTKIPTIEVSTNGSRQ